MYELHELSNVVKHGITASWNTKVFEPAKAAAVPKRTATRIAWTSNLVKPGVRFNTARELRGKAQCL
jgi:hypothetical protein